MITDEERDPWRDRDGDGTIQDTYRSKHSKIDQITENTAMKITENTTMKIIESIEIYHSQSKRHGHNPADRRYRTCS